MQNAKYVDMPAPIDLAKLRKNILAEDGKALEILSKSKSDILTYDKDDFYGNREISYHLVPPTAQWLSSLFLCGSNCKDDVENDYKEPIINSLLKFDPNMLTTLRHIIFFRDYTDVPKIVEALGLDECDWPDAADEALGLMWFEQSAVIVNLGLIEEVETEEAELFASMDDGETSIEDAEMILESQQAIDECVYVTLLHELRHLGLMNPFLPESLYPASETSEDAVEAYGRAAYEVIFEKSKG